MHMVASSDWDQCQTAPYLARQIGTLDIERRY